MKIKVHAPDCGVLAGSIIEIRTRVCGWRRFRRSEYFLCCDGGAVLCGPEGRRGPVMFIDTTGYASGTYRVKAHVVQGPAPWQQADAETCFRVWSLG
jgi:hypothetical protein